MAWETGWHVEPVKLAVAADAVMGLLVGGRPSLASIYLPVGLPWPVPARASAGRLLAS